ncbi:hypothetical protein OG799_01625 [Micromonospora sp. NBC_00898]|uniref:hypothetical protein n=1 Tax=Micromonospora sp. NBC_00898 TaxID=2975981 RepID=UPI00386CF561|nr:hypothetical protein OG799_01625 [Micromonospora sp. NBC_00898]
MSGSDLAALVRSYLDDGEVALLPDEPDREPRLNTWCYGVPEGQMDVTAVVAALHLVRLELQKRWSGQDASGTFYAWYDEQAGQLRCSLTSASPDRLPFGAPYRSTSDAAEVVALAAADPSPGLVPWEELETESAAASSGDQELPSPFPVWVAPLV